PRGQRRTYTITSSRQVAAVVAAFNDLRAPQPELRNCATRPVHGTAIRVTFSAGPARPPIAGAGVDPHSCGAGSVTVGGEREPKLSNEETRGPSFFLTDRLAAIVQTKFRFATG